MRLKTLLKTLVNTSKPVNLRCYSQEYSPKALRSLKPKSTRNTVQYYVDSFKVRAVAGNGGNGCISFLSAWCKDHAGPDGGDGGHGGHVIFQATHTVKSLNHIKSVVTAKHGERGYNKDCNGKNATHVVIPVPLGTIVKDSTGRVVGDLSAEGVMFVAARGGAGGKGNKAFLTDTQQAPDIAELGAEGETNRYTLEVRSMAHLGLIGLPNAGKSSLLRALTRARPNVAPYPFTTLHPHIGVIPYDDYEQVAIADLPGLIPGSHKNYGLGIQFLQHVDRCRGLIFLLDGTSNPLEQYDVLTHELQQYNRHLITRPFCIVVNKLDLPEGRSGFEEVLNALGSKEKVSSSQCYSGFEVTSSSDVTSESSRVRNTTGSQCCDGSQITSDFSSSEIDENSKLHMNGSQTSCESKTRLDSSSTSNSSDGSQIPIDGSESSRVTSCEVIGISAKTGYNLSSLLKIVRNIYDTGSNN